MKRTDPDPMERVLRDLKEAMLSDGAGLFQAENLQSSATTAIQSHASQHFTSSAALPVANSSPKSTISEI